MIDLAGHDRADHLGQLRLRRYRAGELNEEDRAAVARHLASCHSCRERDQALEEEQRAFERQIPFERFAGGVERARRVPRRDGARRRWVAGATVLLAAAAAVVLVVRPADRNDGPNRIKGAAIEATARIASADGAQRSVTPGSTETLRPGDRVRFGHRVAEPRRLVAVSVDAQGAVTPLYPVTGEALAIAPGSAFTFLPDSLEFTGDGDERVFLVVAHDQLSVDQVTSAVRDAYQRNGGKVEETRPTVRAADAVFTWTFRKP